MFAIRAERDYVVEEDFMKAALPESLPRVSRESPESAAW